MPGKEAKSQPSSVSQHDRPQKAVSLAGSRFEHHANKSKAFEFFTYDCEPTDDSVMTIAVMNALMECDGDWSQLEETAIKWMQTLGQRYPYAGYGGKFRHWIRADNPQPYNSWGNGSAMRVSPCAYAAKTLDEAIDLSRRVTEVTHNHPEGIKGAEAVIVAIFMALHGSSIGEIKDYISEHYYPMDFTLDEIRDEYHFHVSCQRSVPESIKAFLESSGFEDAVRNAVSLGGDADTMAAIAGSIAEAYYGISEEMRTEAFTFLDPLMAESVKRFEAKYSHASADCMPSNE